MNNLKDIGAERLIMSSLLQTGRDAFIDIDAVVSSEDFTLPINKVIYTCASELYQNDKIQELTEDAIKLQASQMGFKDYFEGNNKEYLDVLYQAKCDNKNLDLYTYQVKKLAIVRKLYGQYNKASDYIESLTGKEKLSEIISQTEEYTSDFMAGLDDKDAYISLSGDICDYVEELLKRDPVDQIGIPTGYNRWDKAIGGGLRRGTVSVIGSRSKVGKSFDAVNRAINISKLGIPILYLDTELTQEYQQNRMISIDSKCPLSLFENGQFKGDTNLVQAVKESAKTLQSLPIYYKSISGLEHQEAMSIARRWLVKNVGFNNEGKANDCVIIYDYFKLMSKDQISKSMPEYMLLGFMLTELHNFALKYNIPIVGYVQLNRDGIDGDDSSVVAGSDRILWLCSNLSYIKNKGEDDAGMGCGWEFGNKKLIVVETRHGPGLQWDNDFINLHASLRPNVNEKNACGYIQEGKCYSEIYNERRNQSDQKSSERSDNESS